MNYSNLLITGGTGLLGKQLKPLLADAYLVGSSEFDLMNSDLMNRYLDGKEIKTILHAGAFTSPPKINADPKLAIDVNIIGTCNLVKICMERNIKLIYICTDYVFKGDQGMYKEDDPVLPANKYAWSKLGGECAVRMYDNSLIVRTSFGEMTFPYEKAFIDQWTSRLRVDEMARRLVKLINSDLTGTIHIGDKRQTVMEYACGVSPEKTIGKLSLTEVSFVAPKDTSLDTRRYDEVFGKV
ncbi:MAG: sugar nucleotide-binding protein [Comamonadaceae bacterium]|nr:sugar nucleotide-binding protein [Comamonadaceae bacterium]